MTNKKETDMPKENMKVEKPEKITCNDETCNTRCRNHDCNYLSCVARQKGCNDTIDQYKAYEKHKEARMPSVKDIYYKIVFSEGFCVMSEGDKINFTNLAKAIHSLYEKWWREEK